MSEYESIGHQCTVGVLLRNPDIYDRVSQPELFDRFGILKEKFQNPDERDLDTMLEQMSLSRMMMCSNNNDE